MINSEKKPTALISALINLSVLEYSKYLFKNK